MITSETCKRIILSSFFLLFFTLPSHAAYPLDDCMGAYEDAQVSDEMLVLAQAGDPEHKGLRKMLRELHDLPPAERDAKLDAMKAEHPHAAEHIERLQEIRAELKDMPPEERKDRMKELRSEFEAKHEARKADMQKRWDEASPEQRQAFCDKARMHCDKGRRPACDLVQTKCSE